MGARLREAVPASVRCPLAKVLLYSVRYRLNLKKSDNSLARSSAEFPPIINLAPPSTLILAS